MAQVMREWVYSQIQDANPERAFASLEFSGLGSHESVKYYLVPDDVRGGHVIWGSITLEHLEEINSGLGFYYFKPKTLAFHKSRITNIEVIDGRVYFVDSTQGFDLERDYKVRYLDENAHINDYTKDTVYTTLVKAKSVLKAIKKGKVKA